jgi:hypothetical protein
MAYINTEAPWGKGGAGQQHLLFPPQKTTKIRDISEKKFHRQAEEVEEELGTTKEHKGKK